MEERFSTVDELVLESHGKMIKMLIHDKLWCEVYSDDEYERELNHIPKYLGGFGISTGTGIAYEITKELIIVCLNRG